MSSNENTATRPRVGDHPMGVVSFIFVLFIIPALGFMVTGFAEGKAGVAGIAAAALIVSITAAVWIYSSMARTLNHSPLLPDLTRDEEDRYLRQYR